MLVWEPYTLEVRDVGGRGPGGDVCVCGGGGGEMLVWEPYTLEVRACGRERPRGRGVCVGEKFKGGGGVEWI